MDELEDRSLTYIYVTVLLFLIDSIAWGGGSDIYETKKLVVDYEGSRITVLKEETHKRVSERASW